MPGESSASLPDGPAATILQPKSVRLGGTNWGWPGFPVTTRPSPSRPRHPTRFWPAIADLLPKVMDNLMPHMLPDVVPLISDLLIAYLKGAKGRGDNGRNNAKAEKTGIPAK